MPPPPIIVVRSTSHHSGIRCQQARTRFSSTRTVFRLTRSLRWLSFRRVLATLRASTGTELTLVAPHWAQCPWFSDLLQLSLALPVVLPARRDLLRLPRSCHISPGSQSAQASCLTTLQRFPRASGFYSAVAVQSSLARRPSSRAVYQVRWYIYREWYHTNGHSVSRPTLAKVADFLYWLRYTRGLMFPPCMVTVQCYLRCSIFTFHPCLRIR